MSFVENSAQQVSLFDSYAELTSREKKFLENSWAVLFSKEIFPMINEEIFSVLYSDNPASRPNTPVNVTFGGLILKECFDCTDDEMVENLMFDIRYQIALHMTSFKEQSFSDKTLSRFRKRCYEYETLTGVDIIHECKKI